MKNYDLLMKPLPSFINPCPTCPNNNGSCCGCNKGREYLADIDKFKKLGILEEAKTIVQYRNLVSQLTKIQNEIAETEKKIKGYGLKKEAFRDVIVPKKFFIMSSDDFKKFRDNIPDRKSFWLSDTSCTGSRYRAGNGLGTSDFEYDNIRPAMLIKKEAHHSVGDKFIYKDAYYTLIGFRYGSVLLKDDSVGFAKYEEDKIQEILNKM